ncbi:hydrolase psoB [Aspergillus brunneoviolaceus CBS 621.78]|uniref:Uncharacterized protein n=1 Tax=Aspergillus brunneoviolaceus CBS 621.78 TaxID=1450534 RepID=A0ACD1FZZ6_9EURO|nr:hypothetical protein BO95DRAFT_475824 [Aspergillus brunneoviolaceus CBS 621.78]RAH42532.1 hypothetical protein BO95DRAFT_475824 [Aspergillus brunneoviolaceus CBS 621.78]
MFKFYPSDFFHFEFLRVLASAPAGGAETGECLAVLPQVADGDAEAWYRAWTAQAQQARGLGDEALVSGDTLAASGAYLRASNYFRASEFFLHTRPDDPRLLAAIEHSVAVFDKGVDLLDTCTVARVEIPYEEEKGAAPLPGRLYLPRSGAAQAGQGQRQGKGKLPLLIMTGGFDSTQEELYFFGPAAALPRGYAVLTFEGPGQGICLRRDGLRLRPDWEHVTTKVLDVVESQLAKDYPIDLERVAVVGASLGGYFALRAAADPRVRACVSCDACYDLFDVTRSRMPGWFINGWLGGRLSDGFFNWVVNRLAGWSFQLRWEFGHSMWVYGVETPAEVMRCMQQYHARGFLQKVKCSTFVTGAADTFYFTPKQNTEPIFEALGHLPPQKRRLWVGKGVEGGGLQAKIGAWAVFHQKMFAWLDEQFEIKRGTIQAAAALNNLTLDVPQPFAFGTANKSPEFLQKFPTGKVPAFESSDGEVTLVESDAIAQYVAGCGPAAPALLGRNVAEQAAVRQWICFAENEVFRNMAAVVLWRVGMREYDAGVDAEGAKGLEEALAVVERHLAVGKKEKEFLATEGELSLADLTLASALFWAFMHYIDEEMRGRFPRVVRWYLRVVGAERVREVFGEPCLVAVRKVAPV